MIDAVGKRPAVGVRTGQHVMLVAAGGRPTPTWDEANAVREAGTWGEGTTPDAPGDGLATVGDDCT
jgi:hypothetical protein